MHRPTSARRGLRTVVLALLATALLLPTPPASAETVRPFDLERTTGFTPGTEPSRTLVSARADVTYGPVTRVRWQVELAAEPTAGTTANLQLVVGVLQGDDCMIQWYHSFPTFDPRGEAERDGTVITTEGWRDPHEQYTEWNCAEVLVAGHDGPPPSRYDYWGATAGTDLDVEPRGFARIVDVRHRRLPVGEWSYVLVDVRNERDDLSGLVIGGSGRGLRVRETAAEGPVLAGDERSYLVAVKLRRGAAADLTLVTTPTAGRDRTHTVEVRIRPRR